MENATNNSSFFSKIITVKLARIQNVLSKITIIQYNQMVYQPTRDKKDITKNISIATVFLQQISVLLILLIETFLD